MDWDWGSAGSGAMSGAGIGATALSWLPGGAVAGGAVGGAIGSIFGGFGGGAVENEAQKRQEELQRLLAPEQYTEFGMTPAGQRLQASLMAQVEAQYKQGKQEGLTRSARTTQGRGMMSSTVLPYAQAQAMAPVIRERGLGTARVGQIMTQNEQRRWEAFQSRKLQKDLAAAGYLQQAGMAGQQSWGQFMGGAMDLGSTMFANKMGQNWQQQRDTQWQNWWQKQQGGE